MHEKLIVALIILGVINGYSQTFKNKYKDLLEPNSTLIESGFNYTVEEISPSQYVLKRYFPLNRQITQFAMYSSKQLDVLDGDYFEKYDNGEIVYAGRHSNNLKVGEWIENQNNKGTYVEGVKQGKWLRYDSEQRVSSEENYLDGQLHGMQLNYDTVGQIKYEEQYENGQLISTTRDTMNFSNDAMPRFQGCENFIGTIKDKKKCADNKMLAYIYKRIKYPKKAKRMGIGGRAVIRFEIAKDGSVINVESMRGITKEIRDESVKVIKGMPKWKPGIIDGKPKKIQFYLPIKFLLD